MPLEQAKTKRRFGQVLRINMAENVKVYTIGDVSKEICGGPHAKKHGGELGKFRIVKERIFLGRALERIKAVLELI